MKEILAEMEAELVEVKKKILNDLDDLDDIDERLYAKHLGQEDILEKYIKKIKSSL